MVTGPATGVGVKLTRVAGVAGAGALKAATI